MGEKIDSGYSYTESIFWTYIKKISLGPIIKDKGNRIFTDVQSTVVNNPKDKDISDIDILSIDQQKWSHTIPVIQLGTGLRTFAHLFLNLSCRTL
jgi:hypothetical protein